MGGHACLRWGGAWGEGEGGERAGEDAEEDLEVGLVAAEEVGGELVPQPVAERGVRPLREVVVVVVVVVFFDGLLRERGEGSHEMKC